MAAYYNEIDGYCAQWLRNLIAAGLIPEGDVDERDIRAVKGADLAGYAQCHFFAGMGGWPHALRLAGWRDDEPVWTGSCPCQPFSAAGKRGGFADARDLWPAWFDLIRERRPAIVFGEQVASAKAWLDRSHAHLEGIDYAFGAAVLPACSVDAPHKRERLWFLAHAASKLNEGGGDTGSRWRPELANGSAVVNEPSRLGDAIGARLALGSLGS